MTGKVKLYKVVKVDGKETKELEFNFENLPSNAISRATTFLNQQRYAVANPAMDIELHNLIFGIAAGLALGDAYNLHPKDKMATAMQSVLFFNDTSEDSSTENNSEE